jgi:hypothetical protein
MKNKISLILMMFMFSFATFAQVQKQERKHMDKEHKMHMKMMGDEDPTEFSDRMGMKLDLNAEQKEAVKKAQLKRKESLTGLKEDHQKMMATEDVEDMSKERAEMHEDMMKTNTGFKESMKEILDDSQYTKWETMHTKQMKMHEEKMRMHDEKKMMHGEKGKMKEEKMKMKTTKTKEKVDQDDDNK